MNKIVLILITSFLLLPSCKDDEETEPVWDPSGLYTVEVSVKKRIPIFGSNDEGPSNFDHQVQYGQAMDTSLRACCNWLRSQHNCPIVYTITNVQIFEKSGNYFLKNHIHSSTDSVQITFEIPLLKNTNTLSIADSTSYSLRKWFLSGNSPMRSTGIDWPFFLVFLDLNIQNTEEPSVLKGQWVFKNIVDYCDINLRDGQRTTYYTGEFADITFTRIGD